MKLDYQSRRSTSGGPPWGLSTRRPRRSKPLLMPRSLWQPERESETQERSGQTVSQVISHKPEKPPTPSLTDEDIFFSQASLTFHGPLTLLGYIFTHSSNLKSCGCRFSVEWSGHLHDIIWLYQAISVVSVVRVFSVLLWQTQHHILHNPVKVWANAILTVDSPERLTVRLTVRS